MDTDNNTGNRLFGKKIGPTTFDIVLLEMKSLSAEQRLEIMSHFCKHCGCEQPETGRKCQCWNDE